MVMNQLLGTVIATFAEGLNIHERWFSRTAMDFLLGCDEAIVLPTLEVFFTGLPTALIKKRDEETTLSLFDLKA
jgi:hypothetical protein